MARMVPISKWKSAFRRDSPSVTGRRWQLNRTASRWPVVEMASRPASRGIFAPAKSSAFDRNPATFTCTGSHRDWNLPPAPFHFHIFVCLTRYAFTNPRTSRKSTEKAIDQAGNRLRTITSEPCRKTRRYDIAGWKISRRNESYYLFRLGRT